MSAARRVETGAPAKAGEPAGTGRTGAPDGADGAADGTADGAADTAGDTAGDEAAEGVAADARLHPVKRLVLGIAGVVLVAVGVVLLVLPGPGLLLVLAGLILLSRAVPSVARFVEPVREQAMTAAEASVSSAWRIAGSVLAGLGLFAAGIVWGLRALSWLPFPGWSTGSSLILSGFVLFALLGWSHRRVHGPRSAPGGAPGSGSEG